MIQKKYFIYKFATAYLFIKVTIPGTPCTTRNLSLAKMECKKFVTKNDPNPPTMMTNPTVLIPIERARQSRPGCSRAQPTCSWSRKNVRYFESYFGSLQHSMENFYREFPQFRCTEIQLKMRWAGLHLQLKRVAHEQNTMLAVSSQAQQGSVADKQVFCKGVLPFEVAAGRPTEYSIKYYHWVMLLGP